MTKQIILIYGDEKHSSDSEVIQISPSDLRVKSEYEIIGKTINFLNDLETSSINGLSFLSYLKYDDFSIWWFLRPSITTELKYVINFIEQFEKVIEEKKPTEIKITTDFSKLKLIEQICKKNDIKFSYSKSQYLKFNLKYSTMLRLQKERHKQIFGKKLDTRLKAFKTKKRVLGPRDGDIVFAIPSSYRRSIFDLTEKKSKQGEFIQGNLISLLNQMNYNISCIDLDYTFKGEPDILNERINEGNWIPFESLIRNQQSPKHDEFIEYFKLTLNNNNFRKFIQYSGIDLWSTLEEHFVSFTYTPQLPWYLRIIDSLYDYFKNHKPLAVFLPYETGPLALAIILACEKYGVKTFGLQHGQFILAPDYCITVFRSKDNLLGMPLPSKMILFGELTKQILFNGNNYLIDRLVILGNAAFFELDNLINILKNKNLKSENNIPTNKKIILFHTGKNQKYYNKIFGQNNDEQILEHLLMHFANNSDMYFIIKPHPTEKNIESYKELIKKYEGNNFTVIPGNLFELISLSDLSVSAYSTTITDSITLGTPTLSVKFQENDYFSFLENRGILFTCMFNDLSKTINEIFSKPELIQQFHSKRHEFVKFVNNYPNENKLNELKEIIKS